MFCTFVPRSALYHMLYTCPQTFSPAWVRFPRLPISAFHVFYIKCDITIILLYYFTLQKKLLYYFSQNHVYLFFSALIICFIAIFFLLPWYYCDPDNSPRSDAIKHQKCPSVVFFRVNEGIPCPNDWRKNSAAPPQTPFPSAPPPSAAHP